MKIGARNRIVGEVSLGAWASRWMALAILEQHDAGGEAVDEVLAVKFYSDF